MSKYSNKNTQIDIIKIHLVLEVFRIKIKDKLFIK